MISIEVTNQESLQTLLRAAVLFKFEGGGNADPYMGSPHYAQALHSLLQAVIHEAPNGNDWRETFHLTQHRERLALVISHAARHPRWGTLNTDQRKDWVNTVASPYWLTDEEQDEAVELVESSRQ